MCFDARVSSRIHMRSLLILHSEIGTKSPVQTLRLLMHARVTAPPPGKGTQKRRIVPSESLPDCRP